MIKLEFKTRGKIITRYEVFSNTSYFHNFMSMSVCVNAGELLYTILFVPDVTGILSVILGIRRWFVILFT